MTIVRCLKRLRRLPPWIPVLIVAVVSVVHVTASSVTDNGAGLDSLDGLVGRWLALRETLTEEARKWDEQRLRLQQEIDLLEQQERVLNKQLTALRETTSGIAAQREAMLGEKRAIDTELQELTTIVSDTEAALRLWVKRIPQGLRGQLENAYRAIPRSTEDAARVQLTTRVQNAVVLYAEIEALQQDFHVVTEVLKTPEGVRRQMDVLYIGLARGFAVSPVNDWAAVGSPSSTGWVWVPRPEGVESIRKAVDVFNRDKTARLVNLPLKVSTEEAR